MNILKQWSKVVSSQFTTIVNQIENHEALVESALHDMRDAARRARAQLSKVKQDGEAMDAQLQLLKERKQRWEERAVECGASDREKALECVRRRRQLAEEESHLEKQLAQHKKLQTQLSIDLQKIDTRIAELKRKKNVLSARQSRSQAFQIGALDHSQGLTEIQDIFERWERRISEYDDYTAVDIDELEQSFVEKEEHAELEKELSSLLQRDTSEK
jgi:phage shock protein A